MPIESPDTTIIPTRDLKHYQAQQARVLEFFEVLASLDKALSNTQLSEQEILLSVQQHLNSFSVFQTISFFMINPESLEFDPYALPDLEVPEEIIQAVERAIEDGNFAWALQQNRALTLRDYLTQCTLVLHAIATPSKKYGMLVGVANQQKATALDLMPQMLTVVLQRTAFALEQLTVRQQIEAYTQELEKTVEARTFEMREALNTAKQSQEQLQAIYNESPDVILVLDTRNLCIAQINPTIRSMLGYEPLELLGKPLSVMFEGSNALSGFELLNALKEGGILLSQNALTKQGQNKQVDLTADLIPWHGGKAVLVIMRDATLRLQAEEERLRLGKLESLGTLAGGIAHDFNNALQIIYSNIQFARSEPSSAIDSYLSTAETVCNRARDIANNLLTFAKGGVPLRKLTDVGVLMNEVLEPYTLKREIQYVYELEQDKYYSQADASQLKQALHQVLNNAVEAKAQHITLECKKIRVTPEEHILNLPEGVYIQINIKDDGEGIPKENLLKIFDPYFTTKHGKSGLGLTTAFAIVRNHGGYLTIHSEKAHGTVVEIYLPATNKEESFTSPSEPADVSATSRKKIRILHMDDEELIRDVVQIMLTRQGYEVISAAEGKEATLLYQEALERGTPFDVAILDLTVNNGWGGRETIEQLRKLDPAVKAVVCSGYSNDPILSQPEVFGFTCVLPKPFDNEQLVAMMHKLFS